MTIDGIGGAGKSTVTAALVRQLTDRGRAVHATTEPSTSELGRLARHGTETYRGHDLACLVAADRYHHLRTQIRPRLAAGDTVVCDRYVPSSYVLQRIDGVPIEFVATINAAADVPDLAVVLVTDPTVACRRVHHRGAHNRFEAEPASAQLEADLYHDAVERLSTLGWPLLTLDTTDTPTDQVATHIATHLLGGASP